MLVSLRSSELERYAGEAYRMALTPAFTGYPVYYDGIKTREDFVRRVAEAFAREGEGILLFFLDGVFSGWVHYCYLAEDRYLETASLCARAGMETLLGEFLAFVGERFPGADVCLGFPEENGTALRYLLAHGFRVGERSWNMTLRLTGRETAEGVVPVGRENFFLFGSLHARRDGEMYWDNRRILASLDRWLLLAAVRDGAPAGAVCCMRGRLAEIFAVDFVEEYDGGLLRTLLRAAAGASARDGSRDLVYFCGDREKQDALACGFGSVGRYVMVERKNG